MASVYLWVAWGENEEKKSLKCSEGGAFSPQMVNRIHEKEGKGVL